MLIVLLWKVLSINKNHDKGRMKKRFYTLFLSILSVCGVLAQYVAPSEGVFRIISVEYGAAITENFVNGKLQCAAIGDADDYEQMWVLKKSGSNYTIQNVFTGAYIQTGNSGTEVPYWTGSAPKNFNIVANNNWGEVCYNIWDTGLGNGQGLHSKGGTGNIVRWYAETGKAASEWRFVSIDITDEQIAQARAAFKEFSSVQAQQDTYAKILSQVFEDAACTALKAEYTAMSDAVLEDELTALGLPAALTAMAVKVKNDAWDEANENGKPSWDGKYAKKFRVQLVEPYSIAGEITEWFGYNAHSNMDNPTGVYANKCEVAYIMVEGKIKDGAELWATWINGHSKMPNYSDGYSNGVRLKEGLNVVPFGADGSAIFINYLVHTYDKLLHKFPHKLSEYDDLKVHIEGGHINSYYSAHGDALYTADTDADWVYYEERANLENITILGRHQVLQFNLNDVTEGGTTDRGLAKLFPEELPKSLPENQRINAIVEAWDRIMLSELMTLGVVSKEKVDSMNALYPRWDGTWENKAEIYNYEGYVEYCEGVDYSEYYNHHGLAFGVGGNSYMYGTWDHCGYHRNTTPSILTQIATESGPTWGPAHEIGHQHQGLFTVNGLTEVTNNLFSNIAVWYMGMGTSRVNGTEGNLAHVYDVFVEGDDFFKNNIWALTQMYYRLWLYYHRAGNNTQFYPRLFEQLRQHPMTKGYDQQGKNTILHFYKLCCEAAQEDLTEFFRAYGFFRVMNKRLVGDYSNSEYTQSQADIDAAIASVKAKGYPVNNMPLFINDCTTKATYGHDGKTKRSFWDGETSGGSNAEVGSYVDFLSEDPISGKYLYAVNDLKIKFEGGKGALGFAVFKKDGEIVAFSNYSSFAITSKVKEMLENGEADAVVFGAVEGQVKVLTKAEGGNETEQLAALKTSLTAANDMLALSDDQGVHVGYFKSEALADLKALVEAAEAARDNKDTSVHTYGEWSKLLDQAMRELKANNDAKVPLYAGDHYALGSVYQKNTSVEYSTAGLKVTFSDAAANTKKQWLFVPTGVANQYYIQCISSGLYISTASENVRVKAAVESTDKAIAFNLVEAEPAHYYLQSAANTNLNLICDGSKNIVAAKNNGTSAMWTLTSVVDNHSEAMKAKLEGLFGMVDITLESLLAATEPEVKFHEDITILDEQLPAYVATLLEAYASARKALEEGYAYLDAVYAKLAAAHDQVKASFRKALYQPEATTGDEVMCYYLQCLSTEAYAYQFTGTGRYNGAIRTGELSDASDKNFWFYLRPGEAEGQYYIYNLVTGKAAGSSARYLYVNGSADAAAYTIEVSAEEYGYIISSESGAWGVQSSDNGYAQFSAKAALWNLIPIGRFSLGAMGINPVEQVQGTGIYYDLLGRPVENPSAGIYIHNGRKVIIK